MGFIKNHLVKICILCLLIISNITYSENNSSVDIQGALNEAYSRYKDIKEGHNADYIPELAKVNPNYFSISLVTIDGQTYEVGDTSQEFAIESISKLFSLAEVLNEIGSKALLEKIGVNATGQKFNSISAIELSDDHRENPFVNGGAIAVVSLINSISSEDKWNKISNIMRDFDGGKDLNVNNSVYESESSCNSHNEAIALLLYSYNLLYADPKDTVDLYTKMCSVSVTSRDLAVMGSVLANGGTNPITQKVILSNKYTSEILSIMATAGLYDNSGTWIFETGIPAKSGVGGGILAVVPGRFAIAAFSPPLDPYGNSVRAQLAIKYIAKKLKCNIFLPSYTNATQQ